MRYTMGSVVGWRRWRFVIFVLPYALYERSLALRVPYIQPTSCKVHLPSMFFADFFFFQNHLKHARVISQLFRILTSTDEGCQYFFFQDCLADIFDRLKTQIQLNVRTLILLVLLTLILKVSQSKYV